MDTCQHEFYQHEDKWQCISCGAKVGLESNGYWRLFVFSQADEEISQAFCQDLAAEINRMFTDPEPTP